MTNEMIRTEIEIPNKESLVEKFFSTKGRIDRSTYFQRNLVIIAAELVLIFTLSFLDVIATVVLSEIPAWIDISLLVVLLISLVPSYFLDVKRLHDLGKDSTLAKIFLGIGILSVVYSLAYPAVESFSPIETILSIATLGFTVFLFFKKGEDKANQYGEVQ